MAYVRVLLFASNPSGTTPLRLDHEVREIESKVRAADHRDNLRIITKWAVRPDDLLQFLNEKKPNIVHFSGHGSPTEKLVLMDSEGRSIPVSKEALAALFRTMRDSVRLVVLNACFSESQANAIVQEIDCAIGMSRGIGDRAAITFAASFYRALGFGCSVKEAFEQGKVSLQLEGIPEETTPILLCREGIDPAELVLVEAMPASKAEAVKESRHAFVDTKLVLRVIDGPFGGLAFPLDRHRMTIGRATDCDIHLADPYISRTHCGIDWDSKEGAYVLRAYTRAGVAINGRVVKDGNWALKVGDELQIGSCAMRLESG